MDLDRSTRSTRRVRRAVALAALLSVALAAVATVLVPGAYGFDIGALAHPGSIVDQGEGVAQMLRVGALVDMVSYLPFAALVVYFHHRLQGAEPVLVTLLTAAGLTYVLIGAIAGALLAAAGPPLIEGYASASAAGREAARVTLDALGNVSFVGLWGTLELIPLGVWMVGVGWLRRSDWRAFAGLPVVGGVGALASSIRTGLTGRTIVDLGGPIDAMILSAASFLVVWQLWLAVRLWNEGSASV